MRANFINDAKTFIARTFDRITIISIGVIIAALVSVTATPKIAEQIKTIAKFPATACPSNIGDGSAFAALTNSKSLVREIPGTGNKLSKAGVSNYTLNSKPLLVDGNANSTVEVLKGSAGALSTTICSLSNGDQWFVGGSGTVLSKGVIDIVNSGLSAATVDLFPFNSKSALALVTEVVKPNSELKVPLDSLAPGEDSIVVHSVTRSGRASVYMFDDRHKGLRSLGSDFVAPVSNPAQHLVIPAISNSISGKGNPTQILRILVPGNVDAALKANISSTDGSFAPIEIDGKNIAHGRVFDLPIKPIVNGKSYSLTLDSDQPIVASVQSSYGNDFAWSTAVPPLTTAAMNLAGMTPSIEFQGANISVNMSWIGANGKSGSQTLTGSDFVTWTPKIGITRISLTSDGKSYGAMLLYNGSARSHLPIAPGATIENSGLPSSDARVIARG